MHLEDGEGGPGEGAGEGQMNKDSSATSQALPASQNENANENENKNKNKNKNANSDEFGAILSDVNAGMNLQMDDVIQDMDDQNDDNHATGMLIHICVVQHRD